LLASFLFGEHLVGHNEWFLLCCRSGWLIKVRIGHGDGEDAASSAGERDPRKWSHGVVTWADPDFPWIVPAFHLDVAS
jgi:hypothetical protein